jgi:hypothetical protein
MAISFGDQVLAYLANSANLAPFIGAIGLAAYAGTSFTRQYGQGAFQVDNVQLSGPDDLQLQLPIMDDVRIIGTRERRNERPERQWVDYRIHKQEQLGWVDVSFTTSARFALHAVPGTLMLGPGADVQQDGVDAPPPPMNYRLKFRVPIATDAFTLSYTLQVYMFVSAELNPTDDLRRILLLRQHLEADPRFLASLDGPPDQQPFIFVQIYPAGAADGGPLSQAAIVQLFDAADVLAAFFTVPAL